MKINKIGRSYYKQALKPNLQNTHIKTYSNNLLKSTLTGLAILGASALFSSCINNELEEDDLYTGQCPKVVTAVRTMDGFTQKADYMLNLMGLLPKNKSIVDLKTITIEKQNGDIIKLETKLVEENSIKMDYYIKKTDGSNYSSEFELCNSEYGYITAFVKQSEGVNSKYISYTQSTTDQNDLHEFFMGNNPVKAIIKKTNNGLVRIKEDNTKEYFKVSTGF